MTAQAGTIQNARQLRKSAGGNRVLVRTLLVILQSMVSAVVFSFVFLFNGRISPLFLVFALLAATGLVTGMTTRRLLKTNIRLLQYLVGLISLFSSLFALNYFSSGVLGISYLTIYQADFDPLAFIQVGISLFTSGLALTAWRKPKNRMLPDEVHDVPYSLTSSSSRSSNASPRVAPPRSRRKANRFSSQPDAVRRNSGNHSTSARERISLKNAPQSQRRVSKIRTRRSTLLLNRKNPVKFVGAEDHRCPYCLEPVVHHDPRGVEICPICHTHHHADCWEVTGVCQVPHANG